MKVRSEISVPPILCYCIASILMTVVNKVRLDYPQYDLISWTFLFCKFVVSGAHFSMTFLLLCMQSIVCVFCVSTVKRLGIISFSSFRWKDARAWFPISFLLVTVIYTGSKSLVS